jgi:nicotinamide phosphoribosyltransferase
MNMNEISQAVKKSLDFNVVLDADSYKPSHPSVYPSDIEGMQAYVEPRISGETIVPFGIQMWVLKQLTKKITREMVNEAEAFSSAHGVGLDREPWDYIIDKYDGYLPVKIKAVREGLPISSSNAIVTIECLDPKLFWLTSYIETSLQRAVWYPTTIASNDFKIRKLIESYFRLSVDEATEDGDARAKYPGLVFMLHDFGGRGVSSEESAQIGGAAHLVNFAGSDTMSGIRAANFYYFCGMSAFSVPATEHSVQCSFGPDRQYDYLKKVLDTYAKSGRIVSIVLDGYDVYREAEMLCTTFKDQIVESGARIVFRPDSGDPLEVIPRLLEMQEKYFGATVNKKGFKVINNVGIIQGDGIDYDMIEAISKKVVGLGYSICNLVFGSGGSLLQKVNRDTFKFAQKVCAIKVNGEWREVAKDPITDPGKKSKAGFLNTFKNRLTGEVSTIRIDGDRKIDSEYEDIMQVIYDCGKIMNMMTLEEVRANVYSK